MTDEEIEKEAKEYAQGNFYLEQGFLYGYELGLAEGKKEGYEQGKNNERESQCGKKNYEKDIARLEKENEKLKAANKELLLKVEALRLERDLYIESRR